MTARTMEVKARRLIAFVLFALVLTIGVSSNQRDANAQSSVRPPANATISATPSPGLGRGSVPSRAAAQTDVREGRVPGGSLGNSSNSEFWRAMRQGISGTVSIGDKKAGQLIQSEGDAWRGLRNSKYSQYGMLTIMAMVVLLFIFCVLRGPITIEHGRSDRLVERFDNIERMGHWLLAVSFIILAITGLNIIWGKHFLLPIIGKPAFATITQTGKWLHNYVAFAFMIGLVWIFVQWVLQNFPNRHDIVWLLKGGGLFSKGVHPPARKFNAGQKIIFWLVILGGASLSLSGLSLMFPFEMTLFSKTFALMNSWFGTSLPTELTAINEMQLSQMWHGIAAFIMITVIMAHIYIGSIGMEGGFDAMGTGMVDENWAKEHHNLWYKEVVDQAKVDEAAGSADKAPQPAE